MKSQPNGQYRHYVRSECAVFRKTNELFGGLSNMAGGYPIVINGVKLRTSEALYQACRFPHLPDVQEAIIGERSPMAAKMRGKPFRSQSRQDWDEVRVSVMRWSIRVKLLQNWSRFSALLEDTGDRPIVEHSRRDRYWGAVALNDEELEGQNVLGRLLMELREIARELEGPHGLSPLLPLDIPEFLLLGDPIPALTVPAAVEVSPGTVSASNSSDRANDPPTQSPTLFD
jgi:type I restriction enzyme S subunit